MSDQLDQPPEGLANEVRELAAASLVKIAQDSTVRAGLRIRAAELLLYGPGDGRIYEDDYEEATRTQQDDATEDVYDAIAERVMTRLAPVLAELKGGR